MAIFTVIFPIFAIALGGYLTARVGVLEADSVRGLTRFVFVVAFPVLLFNSFAKMDLPETVNWAFLLSYYLVAFSMYGLGLWINKRFFQGDPKEQVIFGLGASFANLVLVGLPIISAGIGEQGVLPLFMIVSIQSALFFSLSTILIERGNHRGERAGWRIFRRTLRDLVRNPIVVSMFFGLAVNLSGVSLPGVVFDSLDLFSRAALPCALFMLGASLTEFKVAGGIAQAAAMAGIKMVLLPLLVWALAFGVFKLEPLWGAVAVLAAGMPIGVNTYLFGKSCQANTEALSAAILISSLFAIFSQTLMLSLLINQL